MIAIVVALAACTAYIVISLVVGDRYPFSRYSMYAQLTTRKEGAVLYVKVGEDFVPSYFVEEVSGLDLAVIEPRKVPCSQEWLVYEAQRWLRNHTVETPSEGALPIEVGWRMLRVDEAGELHQRLVPITRGMGHARR